MNNMNLDADNSLTSEEQKLVDELVAQIRRAMGDTAQRFGTRVIRDGTQILRGRRLRMEGFQERLYSRWALPLDCYELCLYVAQGCGDYFNRNFHPGAGAEEDHQFETLIRLQAGAVRVAGEVYALLLAGFPSGAHARWRTLHEIAVTALFIAQEGKETAERYVHHRFVKSYEDAVQYQKYAGKLNEKPFTEDEFQRIEADCKAVLARYGREFRDRYAWAVPALLRRDANLKGAKIGFEHLQRAVDVPHWTPYHRMASHAVHPSATFVRFNLGSREDIPVILAGPSNADLADPGQGAVLSLTKATAALLTFESGSEIAQLNQRVGLSAMITALNALAEFASREFIKVHKQLEKEIEAEKNNPPNISGRAPRTQRAT